MTCFNFMFDVSNKRNNRTSLSSYDSIKAAFASDSSLISNSSMSKDAKKSDNETKSNSNFTEDKNTTAHASCGNESGKSEDNYKSNNENNNNYSEFIVKTFKPEKKFHSMLKQKELVAKNMGTTANIVYITDKKIYVANAGDSFAVMYKNKQAIKLNTEHKITVKSEEDRIINSGYKIINNRIDGKLNLTRAIGKLYN